jgi:hypothetical protein
VAGGAVQITPADRSNQPTVPGRRSAVVPTPMPPAFVSQTAGHVRRACPPRPGQGIVDKRWTSYQLAIGIFVG